MNSKVINLFKYQRQENLVLLIAVYL